MATRGKGGRPTAGSLPARAALLALLGVLIVLVIILPAANEPTILLKAGLLLLLFGAVRVFYMKRIPSPTPSGAIVMANGIFINGAISAFAPLTFAARGLTMALFLLLCFILYSYLRSAVDGTIREMHFSNPVASFAVGTWVAGISVCSISVAQRLPEWLPVARVMVVANVLLWLLFIGNSVRHVKALASEPVRNKVHGVLFLSTVATQSLVIAARVAFGRPAWYVATAPWLIGLGLAFYAASFVLVARRYLRDGRRTDPDTGWFNTNCIIHGAMSITGLASAVSGVVAPNAVLAIWIWVIFWFVVVEAMEVRRAAVRIRRYGLWKGIFSYDPTQWSRNFTFGMLYAFGMNFRVDQTAAAGSFPAGLREIVIGYFGWVVLGLLVIEGAIFLSDRIVISRS